MEKDFVSGKAGKEEETISSSTPKKSILKKPAEKKKRTRSLIWDENNLIVNECNKSSTMKIDEPKTPYHYLDSDEAKSEDEEQDERDQKTDGNLKESLEDALLKEFAKQEQKFLKKEISANGLSSVNTSSDYGSGSEKEDKARSRSESEGSEEDHQFKKKRKSHYDEYKVLMAWRNKSKKSIDDDLDEDKYKNGKDDDLTKMET